MSRLALCAGFALSAGSAWPQGPVPRSPPAPAAAPAREIAITFDDLPAVSVAKGDPPSLAVLTDRRLSNFTAHQVPVAGFVFVPLARALGDPAYGSPDAYVGRFGISWMHHWEQAMGRPRTGAPDPPPGVSDAYEKVRK